jgi:hypothetical protein
LQSHNKDRALRVTDLDLTGDLRLGHVSRVEVGQFWRAATREGIHRPQPAVAGHRLHAALAEMNDKLLEVGLADQR